ncbi:MAG: UDP-N-acetylmuramoyl-L-alanyl-D-glutamate--2,6-diaminopimelate ligase [Corynebacterium sp.]|nr:UDP-N-acetylmuramoyl-L-alanyl-D-glutamate--2,6-diaminopimelate ligase [Corynebacterium sp.]
MINVWKDNANDSAGVQPVALSDLVDSFDLVAHGTVEGVSVDSVSISAQDTPPTGLFVAVPGTRAHGARYADQSSAAAILTDSAGWAQLAERGEERPVLVADDVRAVMGVVSSRVYGDPSADLVIIGVTGTSGKTTTSYMVEAGLAATGAVVGLIGTTGTRVAGRKIPTQLTTPEAPVLHSLFAQMKTAGVTHVVMEVSSHALSLGRVNGTHFDVALFTNLSQDHLDFHPTMEEYFAAKSALFVPGSPVRAATSIICIDDEWGATLTRLAGPAAQTVSTAGAVATYSATIDATADDGSQQFTVHGPKALAQSVCLPVPGRFNVANATLALAAGIAVGADPAQFAAGLATVSVPGRMETVPNDAGIVAIVDYAHKPAAVAAMLETVRASVTGDIAVVVGAGGDRDSGKRELMGAAAAATADLVIVTDDNPRTEDPAEIRAHVLAGAREYIASHPGRRGVQVVEEGDRRAAIERAVAWAKPADAVIVAGKGHEQGQIIGDTVVEFDDREELRRALLGREKDGN